MRRRLAIVVAWVVVTAVATTVTRAAVGIVGESVSPTAAAPVPVDALEPAPPPVAATSPDVAVDPAPSGPTSGSAPATTAPTAGVAATPTVRPPATATAPGADAPSNSTSGPSTTTASSPDPTAAPPASGSPGETRTVTATGGTATFRFTDGRVDLVSAAPENGFRAVVTRQDPDRIELEFSSASHTSRIRARWVNGPVVDVDESGG